MMSISLKGIAMQKIILTAVLVCVVVPVWAQAPAGRQPARRLDPVQAKVSTKAATKSLKKVPVRTQAKAQVVQIARKPAAKPPVSTLPLKSAMAQVLPLLPVAFAAMPMVVTHLGSDELAIAERVHKGQMPCELGASVRVEADVHEPGYFDVRGKGFHYRMHPVSTSTGAIRLEDQKAGAVWLQLANKSMLMDQNKGRRIADECAHPEQVAFAQDMKNNPPPKLFDTTGMGR
jgi:hypothetical protein